MLGEVTEIIEVKKGLAEEAKLEVDERTEEPTSFLFFVRHAGEQIFNTFASTQDQSELDHQLKSTEGD